MNYYRSHLRGFVDHDSLDFTVCRLNLRFRCFSKSTDFFRFLVLVRLLNDLHLSRCIFESDFGKFFGYKDDIVVLIGLLHNLDNLVVFKIDRLVICLSRQKFLFFDFGSNVSLDLTD